MPSRNKVKIQRDGGIYHVYNRGVNAENIFFDNNDYIIFKQLLRFYLLRNEDLINKGKIFSDKIRLHAYTLLPNHFHMCVEQVHKYDMSRFMQSLMGSFVTRINIRHNRIGHLFQDVYKAGLIESDNAYLKTIMYIHNNALEFASKPWEYKHTDISEDLGFVYRDKLLSYYGNDMELYRSDLGKVRPR